MSQAVDLIIKSRWIIPVVPAEKIFENCAVIIDQGRIIAIVPDAEADRRYTAEKVHELPDHILIPGLVNAHGHAAMSLLRGFADDLPLDQWLNNHIWPAEAKWVSEEFVREGTELAMAEMIKSGTTTYADMYFFPEAACEVINQVGMRAQISFPIIQFPTAWASTEDEYIQKGLQLFDQQKGNDLVTIAFGPHAPYTVSDNTFRKIETYAEELGCPIHIHLHETAGEVETAIAESGKRPLQRLKELNILSPLTVCVHMTQINETDIDTLVETGAHVVHCPESNLKLASGFCPVDKLQNAGVNVALGTDGAASNNDLDMLGEMKTAAILGKAVSGDAAAVSAHQVLRMATLNGAEALGIAEQAGSIEVGKRADLTAIKVDELLSTPLYNPVSQLVYNQHGQRVSDLWVDGRQLLSDGTLTTLDSNKLIANARKWQQRIQDTVKTANEQ